jgi:hypothetical protein
MTDLTAVPYCDTAEILEPEHWSSDALHGTVILLDYVVQIFCLADLDRLVALSIERVKAGFRERCRRKLCLLGHLPNLAKNILSHSRTFHIFRGSVRYIRRYRRDILVGI